ncbi:MAG: DNA topoisomerase I [Candidatus Blackburnbacteria bacterium RIFCSPLOWO2_01_FULL_41_27]|uniref:DNA topoisomerase 1 n=2 Tax=Candidatus Blackburniibacteriota TaxID=1817898 RepID=A0A1G1VB84_9BACT|nr:MAG: DNA topoisomerase I [Candidatus Blackburnbacteria bacterium RIFCSPHIGHO2_12_FULL_41_13b]OGY13261.1 MAG: DNA topoisomerase I [Candidatus Blackburnbacteria bacterium RIFCSPLOWO2_01_FULL_41_27]
MNLIIVESPTKARTLGRFLGEGWTVDSTMGHIRDLPKSKIGVDVEHDFAPDYVVVAKKKETIDRLTKESLQSDKVYLATDPDREGEAIAWHTFSVLNGEKSNVKNPVTDEARLRRQKSKFTRIVFHEITESAVKEALDHPRDINLPLVNAQQARRVLDRLVGYKLSPLLWKKVRRGLSAGRVQTVAVKLVVEREREIEAFKNEEYWEIWVELRTQDTEHRELSVKLVKIADAKAEIKNGEQSGAIVADLEKSAYSIFAVDKREAKKSPSPPFTTSTMTQAAARTFGWSAKRTMSVAQKLYEEGLITYHRTDSLNLAAQAVSAVRDYVKGRFGGNFLPQKPRFYKTTSKVAQEAHEAIRPTDAKVTGGTEQVTSLGRDGEMLYGLIWRRFLACQMADSVVDETTISVNAKGDREYLLQVKGEVMKFEGWKTVYKKRVEAVGDILQLPEVQAGDTLRLIKVDPFQKFTLPPPRYTEASLVKTLEKLGIGRPSTYAPTVSTIQDRQYVEKIEGKFQPTSLGFAVNDFLIANFPDVFEYSFTASMEGDLDDIANGAKEWIPVIRTFWDPFVAKLDKVEISAERVKIETETTGKKCPTCGKGDEIIRLGRFGKFLSCSLFPDCKYTAPFVEKIEMKCPGCMAGDVVIKKTRRGKRFFGCSTYPNCKWASWHKPEDLKAKNTPEQVLDTNTVQ